MFSAYLLTRSAIRFVGWLNVRAAAEVATLFYASRAFFPPVFWGSLHVAGRRRLVCQLPMPSQRPRLPVAHAAATAAGSASSSAAPAVPGPARRGPLALWRRHVRWWHLLLLAMLIPAVGVCCFYSLWAGTFDINHLGDMPQRAIVYDMDGNCLQPAQLRREPHQRANRQSFQEFYPGARRARGLTLLPVITGWTRMASCAPCCATSPGTAPPRGPARSPSSSPATACPWAARRSTRKILEAFVALRIERHYSTRTKSWNFTSTASITVPACMGWKRPARRILANPARNSIFPKSAMMAGLIRSPNRFSPLKNLEGATHERGQPSSATHGKLSAWSDADQARKVRNGNHPRRADEPDLLGRAG